MDTEQNSLVLQQVRSMYNLFPYPYYPLCLPLRWIEGLPGSSIFVRLLTTPSTPPSDPTFRIMIAGCGETQPYILRKIEPRRFKIDAVDLSQRNLRRAHQRTILSSKQVQYFHNDLSQFAQHYPLTYDHIDCYGVLHHNRRPQELLADLANSLKPGGTMRLMVYNANARRWINLLQKAFRELGLSYTQKSSIQEARQLLHLLLRRSRSIRHRITNMGPGILNHHHRFVDTFLHACETVRSLDDWWSDLQASDLHLLGLWDRYGELDDLDNPLLHPPQLKRLKERVNDARFENNFELYLQKQPVDSTLSTELSTSSAPAQLKRSEILHLYRCRPPKFWFQMQETRDIGYSKRWLLWFHYLESICRPEHRFDRFVSSLEPQSVQRLARLGALRPAHVNSQILKDLMSRPIYASMESPKYGPPQAIISRELKEYVHYLSTKHGRSQEHARRCLQLLQEAENTDS